MKRRKSLRKDLYLPPEIFADGLARLPVKTLMRFRCVSKTWCSLIDSPYFASKHLKLSKNNCEKTHLMVLERSPKWNGKGCILRRSNTFRKTHQFSFVTDRTIDDRVVEVEGHVNGVLLMHTVDNSENRRKLGKIVLWNPSIRKSVRVPSPPLSRNFNAEMEICFGFDPLRNDYKVVVIVYPPSYPKYPVWIEVYTLSTHSWDDFDCDDFCFRCSKDNKVSLDGTIYMTGYDLRVVSHPTFDTHLVLFDVASEGFSALLLPEVENYYELFGRSVFAGASVGLFDFTSNDSTIWILEKCGETESWTKRYTFNVNAKYFYFLDKKGFVLFENVGEEGLKSYDVNTQEMKHLTKRNALGSIDFIDTYVESLALFNNKGRRSSMRSSDEGKTD